jgi:N-acetylmuramoyl-L-alanine amidase
MKIEKKIFNREEKRQLKQKKAIVIHWPGARKTISGYSILNIDSLWGWMNESTKNSYHYLVSGKRAIQTRELSLRAVHCGHATYRKKAKEYFGYDVCSPNDSPNNYTIAVCALHDTPLGGYATDTMDSLVELCAMLCIDHNLSPETDLWRHSDITGEKKVPCPLGFFEDDDDTDDLWKAFKCWVAVAITHKYEEIEKYNRSVE